MRELEYPFDSEYILKKKRSIKKQLLNELDEGNIIKKKIAILGGSTTNDIKVVLELFLLNYGISPEFYESEYNQYYQDAMFPGEELKNFAPDIVFIHTTNRNISSYPRLTDSADEIQQALQAEYSRFEGMWEQLHQLYHCTIIQNNFEYPAYRLLGNLEQSDIHGKVNYINRLNEKFNAYAREHDYFLIHDIHYLSARYGLEKWSDPFYWHMYKYALCVPAIPQFAFNLANIIKSLLGKNKKAFALDMDNTLWGGIVGDDGVENLELGQETSMGQAYTEFQEYIKEHKQLGVLLNIVSKNEEENALDGLNHEAGVLKPEDFISIKANWEPKDRNLVQIAEELSLLPESFVFVDDNPAERQIIKSSLPKTAVPEMSKVEHYIREIDRAGYFEATTLSKDDLKRTQMYEENAKRSKLQATFTDYHDYLLSLEMKGTIDAFEPIYLARIAQLTNKSNQFNLTTKRFTQNEITEFMENPKYITLYGKLEDKFGDNGVVSVVIGEKDGDKLHILLWLMSCRVLKRNMEQAMFDALIVKAKEAGINEVAGYYYKTAKNAMVKDFYETMGFELCSQEENGDKTYRYVIPEDYKKQNDVIVVSGSVNESK